MSTWIGFAENTIVVIIVAEVLIIVGRNTMVTTRGVTIKKPSSVVTCEIFPKALPIQMVLESLC